MPPRFADFKDKVSLIDDVVAGEVAKSLTNGFGHNTQDLIEDDIALRLRSIAQPAGFTQGGTQSMALSRLDTVNGHGDANDSQGHDDAQLVFDHSRIWSNKRSHKSMWDQVDKLANAIGGRSSDGRTIMCTCGHAMEEGDMVSSNTVTSHSGLTRSRSNVSSVRSCSICTAMATSASTTFAGQRSIFAICASQIHSTTRR